MVSLQQKRLWRRVLSSRWVQALLLVVLLVVASSAYGRYQVAREMALRQERLAQELAELEVRREQLRAQVEYITSERGMEAEMRRQFDVAREGEQVVIILEEPEPAAAPR